MRKGRRYRIDCQNHRCDGRVGTLEFFLDGEAWLTVNGRLVKAPAQCITDRNVVQADLSHLRRSEPELEWELDELLEN